MMTADNNDDSELLYPYYRFLEEGYEVTVASFAKGMITSKHFFKLNADIAFDEIEPKNYDALYIPGGSAPEKIRLSDAALKVVVEFYNMGKPIGSICHGIQVLISAGIMRGKIATCYPGIRDDLINCGAEFRDDAVVVCSGIVTSRRPGDLPYNLKEFLKKI